MHLLLVAASVIAPLASSSELAAQTVCSGYKEEWGVCPGLSPCHTCTPLDCSFGPWSSWFGGSGCTQVVFRERSVSVENNECGQPCKGAKTETKRALSADCRLPAQDCELSGWSDWTRCVSRRDQKVRWRGVTRPPLNGGAACASDLGETQPCSASPTPKPCVMSDWGAWTPCSSSCGAGRRTRMRTVTSEAAHRGAPCRNSTLETAPCHAGPCASQDCNVSSWAEWSFCDAERHTQRYRGRTILQPALGRGAACPQALLETIGCSSAGPTNCVLGDWSPWSLCDRVCDGGQTFRTRYLKAPPANGGDCPRADLRETKACNTQLCADPPHDCAMSTWDSWSPCSAECGLGSRMRKRRVLQPANAGGIGCVGALSELVTCKVKDCEVVDCEWGGWGGWSACSLSCGGGTKRRSRGLAVSPRNGGALCPSAVMSEVAACGVELCPNPCVDALWGAWQEWTRCSASCGGGFKLRSRRVAREANFCGREVDGTREEYTACSGLPPCIQPRDCRLSAWSPWSYCSNSCFGVRERYRVVEESAAGHGKPCLGDSLKELGPCSSGQCAPPAPEDCRLSDWSDWGRCSSSCGGGQAERKRRLEVAPKNGGASCSSSLRVTAACNTQPCVPVQACEDCRWGAWGDWGDCAACGSQRWRQRSIERMANHCGQACDALAVSEVSNCTSACEERVFCAWSSWEDAGTCGLGNGGTRLRKRALVSTATNEAPLFFSRGSAACAGTQLGSAKCSALKLSKPCVPLDGRFGPWSEWSQPACDTSNLCERERGVLTDGNACGRPPEGPLLETKRCIVACNVPVHCAFSQWMEWSACSSQYGQRHRFRNVEQLPANGGRPCHGVLNETGTCAPPCPVAPCQVSTWTDWGFCSQTCGGGWQTRERQISSPAKCGGQLCEEPLQELQVCSAEPCEAADGGELDCALGEWEGWSGCGIDGQRYRERKVMSFASGGKPCIGNLQETMTCGLEKVDCLLSDWSVWAGCDRTCGIGQQSRQRQIHHFARNGGKACPGGASSEAGVLSETRGCSQAPCSVKDCAVLAWSDWSSCTTTCGIGQQSRQRQVAHNRDLGGEGCTAALSQTAECTRNATCPSTDGRWGDWSSWSGCSRSCGGGQKERFREVAVMPSGGGAPVEGGDRELAECSTQRCSPEACQDGVWNSWESWSPCSKTCGGGVASRKRTVAKMATHCGKPVTGRDTETLFCQVDTPCQPTVDCALTPWSPWGDCSTTCNGVKRRSRGIARYGRGAGEYCAGALEQTWPCHQGELSEECHGSPPVDCELSAWTEWSNCSSSCGGGERLRTRGIKVQPQNGGAGCIGPLKEVKECGRQSCDGNQPLDCKLGDWEDWGECSQCGGSRKRFRSIAQHAAYGGKNCKAFASEQLGPCPTNCTEERGFCAWSIWSDWGACSSRCGAGMRSRRRHLELSDKPTDLPAAVADRELVLKFAEAHQRRQHLEAHHLQVLIASFACGCLTFGVAQGAVRLATGVRQRARGQRSAPRGSAGSRRGDSLLVYQHLHSTDIE